MSSSVSSHNNPANVTPDVEEGAAILTYLAWDALYPGIYPQNMPPHIIERWLPRLNGAQNSVQMIANTDFGDRVAGPPTSISTAQRTPSPAGSEVTIFAEPSPPTASVRRRQPRPTWRKAEADAQKLASIGDRSRASQKAKSAVSKVEKPMKKATGKSKKKLTETSTTDSSDSKPRLESPRLVIRITPPRLILRLDGKRPSTAPLKPITNV